MYNNVKHKHNLIDTERETMHHLCILRTRSFYMGLTRSKARVFQMNSKYHLYNYYENLISPVK
jgi:hypothetical protein